MTETPHTITCPNCGSQASGNFCSECGQATHLHKETFGHLIMHFFEHYFHYDSKFLRTMKALWFKPGELTLAYWHGQRMKYIPPISLYIFISAVYFLTSSIVLPTQMKYAEKAMEDFKKAGVFKNSEKGIESIQIKDTIINGKQIRVSRTQNILLSEHPEMLETLVEKVTHILPKLMFFMIPFMGLILKLLFLQRQNAFFVDHVVYSLHWHSFYFSVSLIVALIPVGIFSVGMNVLLFVVMLYYSVLALKKAYDIETAQAIGYSIMLAVAYMFILATGITIYSVWLMGKMIATM